MKTQFAAALLAAACLATPALANDSDQVPVIIVTAKANPEDPPVVAEARERLARTPGSVSVVAAEAYEDRFAVGTPDILRDVPGVLAAKRYGEEGRLSIRGSGLDQSFHQRGVLLRRLPRRGRNRRLPSVARTISPKRRRISCARSCRRY